MKLGKFHSASHPFPCVGLTLDDAEVLDLSGAGVQSLTQLLEDPDLESTLKRWASGNLRRIPISEVCLAAPVENQEVWAAGVTYLRSKSARMEESDFSATAYDRVYAADRPELFFKSPEPKPWGPVHRSAFVPTLAGACLSRSWCWSSTDAVTEWDSPTAMI